MSYSWNWIFLKKIWEIRDLPIEDKITIFKTLAIWRIIYLGLITSVPNYTIERVNIIKKTFFSIEKNSK